MKGIIKSPKVTPPTAEQLAKAAQQLEGEARVHEENGRHGLALIARGKATEKRAEASGMPTPQKPKL